ncbi:hypothetical protein [Streptomyces sp. NPDC086023]|uniref:hypothetical protein n=1 Tax=Streptomyces sp. NPDC086023 TaxID=3365746 RepID=UPI0037D28817
MARERDISDARLHAIRTWLTEQGIDPSTVPIDATLVFTPTGDGTAVLRYSAFVREEGRIKWDPETGGPVLVPVVHPVSGPVPEFPA